MIDNISRIEIAKDFDIKIKIGHPRRKLGIKGKSDVSRGLSCYYQHDNTIYLNNPKTKRWHFRFKGYFLVLLEHEYLHAVVNKLEGYFTSSKLDNILSVGWDIKKMICSHNITVKFPLFEPDDKEVI